MILMVGTMFLSMRQYFGEPIECLNRQSDIPQQLLQVDIFFALNLLIF